MPHVMRTVDRAFTKNQGVYYKKLVLAFSEFHHHHLKLFPPKWGWIRITLHETFDKILQPDVNLAYPLLIRIKFLRWGLWTRNGLAIILRVSFSPCALVHSAWERPEGSSILGLGIPTHIQMDSLIVWALQEASLPRLLSNCLFWV